VKTKLKITCEITLDKQFWGKVSRDEIADRLNQRITHSTVREALGEACCCTVNNIAAWVDPPKPQPVDTGKLTQPQQKLLNELRRGKTLNTGVFGSYWFEYLTGRRIRSSIQAALTRTGELRELRVRGGGIEWHVIIHKDLESTWRERFLAGRPDRKIITSQAIPKEVLED
jgi:hypothetical protein